MLQQKPSALQEAIRASRKSFVYVAGFSFIINILMLTVSIYMLQIFDRVLSSRSTDTLIYLTVIAVFAIFIMSLLDMARSRIMVKVSQWLDNYLNPVALTLSGDAMIQGRTYGPQSLRDVATIRTFFCGSSVLSFFDFPWVPVYLGVIYYLHPGLGAVAISGAVILFSLALLNEISTRKPLKEASSLSVTTQTQIETAMRNAEAIQAMGMMPDIVRAWYKKNERLLGLQTIASNRSGLILSLAKFVRLSLQLFILGLGAYFVIQGHITPGVMLAGSILMGRGLAPIEQIIGAWKQMISAKESYVRLKAHMEGGARDIADIKLPAPKGEIKFEKVYCVSAGIPKTILADINLMIRPGETLGVIGPAASGKSSLVRLMVGAWKPNSGHVRLDGAEVYHWERTDFGQHVGYLPQDIELFPGTVKDNIARMGIPNDKEIVRAAKLAGVHELILRLPNGYDTEINMGKFNLSGGQRQRIALARAVYKRPQVVVLDEPNSNLDTEGETALEKAILTLKNEGATIVLVSHRQSIVKYVDRLLVLHEGRIKILGPKEEVVNKLSDLRTEKQGKPNIHPVDKIEDKSDDLPGEADGQSA